jgi:hypothetical protein
MDLAGRAIDLRRNACHEVAAAFPWEYLPETPAIYECEGA